MSSATPDPGTAGSPNTPDPTTPLGGPQVEEASPSAGGVIGDPTVADTSVPAVRRDTLGEGDNILQVRDLRKEFPITKGLLFKRQVDAVRAVDGVSFDVRRGETFGLVGESGCGKSTTARMICRLLDPTSGQIDFDGTDIAGLSRKQLVPFRRDVQMVFQDPYSSLNPRQTIGSIIGAPLDIHGLAKGDGERKRKVQELMDLVGLNPEHYNRLPHEFSGGQRQRIGIARAIALSPKLLIADEPVSALDVSIQAQILNLLRRLQRDLGLSLLFIAHDLSVVRYMCDRMAVMYAGEIVELATSEELYANPSHPYTRALLDAVPTPDPDARARRLAERGTAAV
ncbi:ABC transporter ATP-binding protein [Patulibacter sp.]|uniref:ABC transporter ATP-binding protein n=1 Tax=Patulibacter sp. TaxID=1912859 RepID=UPI00271B3522|nr:ATP-binding cassette domain-containing protein [Patulibacter sp.]MDO9410183.1 ATP-binding cassette domain-containing protein [Patulibacter sp.]